MLCIDVTYMMFVHEHTMRAQCFSSYIFIIVMFGKECGAGSWWERTKGEEMLESAKPGRNDGAK